MGLPTPLARVLDAVQGTASPRVHQAPAVRWLSVPQLVRTAVDVLQASSFAKYADKRETMATSPREFYRLPAADEEPRTPSSSTTSPTPATASTRRSPPPASS